LYFSQNKTPKQPLKLILAVLAKHIRCCLWFGAQAANHTDCDWIKQLKLFVFAEIKRFYFCFISTVRTA